MSDHAATPSGDEMRRRGSIGGYALAAKRTAAERSEAARHAKQAYWDRVNEERAAAGLPPTKKTPKPLDDEVLALYLELVDERFGADYAWPNKMARKRQAIQLAREAAARAAAEAFRRAGDA